MYEVKQSTVVLLFSIVNVWSTSIVESLLSITTAMRCSISTVKQLLSITLMFYMKNPSKHWFFSSSTAMLLLSITIVCSTLLTVKLYSNILYWDCSSSLILCCYHCRKPNHIYRYRQQICIAACLHTHTFFETFFAFFFNLRQKLNGETAH